MCASWASTFILASFPLWRGANPSTISIAKSQYVSEIRCINSCFKRNLLGMKIKGLWRSFTKFKYNIKQCLRWNFIQIIQPVCSSNIFDIFIRPVDFKILVGIGEQENSKITEKFAPRRIKFYSFIDDLPNICEMLNYSLQIFDFFLRSILRKVYNEFQVTAINSFQNVYKLFPLSFLCIYYNIFWKKNQGPLEKSFSVFFFRILRRLLFYIYTFISNKGSYKRKSSYQWNMLSSRANRLAFASWNSL